MLKTWSEDVVTCFNAALTILVFVFRDREYHRLVSRSVIELDSRHTQPFSVRTTEVVQKHLVLSPDLYPCHNGLVMYVICALLINYDLYMLIYLMWGDAFGEGVFIQTYIRKKKHERGGSMLCFCLCMNLAFAYSDYSSKLSQILTFLLTSNYLFLSL